MDTDTTKYCPCCFRVKALTCFYKRSASPNGLQAKCKDCQRVYRRKHTARYAEYQRNRYQRVNWPRQQIQNF